MQISLDHLHIFCLNSQSSQLSLDKYRRDHVPAHFSTFASALFCTRCPPLHFNSFNCVKLNHKSKINYSYYNDCDDVYDFQSLNERDFHPRSTFPTPKQLHPKWGVPRQEEVPGPATGMVTSIYISGLWLRVWCWFPLGVGSRESRVAGVGSQGSGDWVCGSLGAHSCNLFELPFCLSAICWLVGSLAGWLPYCLWLLAKASSIMMLSVAQAHTEGNEGSTRCIFI